MRRVHLSAGLASFLLVTGCTGTAADSATSDASVTAAPSPLCGTNGAILPYDPLSGDQATYHDTPEEAAAAVHRYLKEAGGSDGPLPVASGETLPAVQVPAVDVPAVDVPADGYAVTVSDDGLSAVLRSGVFELDAVKEEQGWRLALIRVCGDYTPSGLPAPPTYQPSAPASPNG